MNFPGGASIRARLPPVWVLGILSLMALVLGVNLTMILIATSHAPNLVVEDYYEQGLAYDQVIAARQESQATGWRMELLPPAARGGVVTLRVVDSGGEPVTGLTGNVAAFRPSDANFDQTLDLTESSAKPGLYSTRFQRPLPGLWRLTVRLRGAGAALHESATYVAP